MGFLDSVKSFLHSVTTEDHYALYGSPYSNSSAGGSINNSSTTRLLELNNSLSHSLISGRNSSSVGYRPGMRSLTTNLAGTGDVAMQSLGTNGQPPLPSVEALWHRLEAWIDDEYPELEDSLNLGASLADLNEFERDLHIGPLPVEVRQYYKTHDGQFRGGQPTGLLMGMTLLDMESTMEEYALWAKVAERVERQQLAMEHQQSAEMSSLAARDRLANNYLSHQRSVPVDAVQSYYIHRGWVPIARDACGNLIGLDLAPGPAGQRGQIILYGRDFDTKVVVASSLPDLLFQLVSDLESGNFQVDHTESNEDNGYLDSSRIDDYGVGDEDEGNGELTFLDRDGREFGNELRGKLTYIDVLKRRALKRHGVANVDSFQTAFTPQRVPKKKPEPAYKLVNLDVDLPKETLIDDEPLIDETAKETATEASTEETKAEPEAAVETTEPEATEPEVAETKTDADGTTEIAL